MSTSDPPALSWPVRISLVASAYALVVGAVVAYAAFGPSGHGEWLGRHLDLDDQLFFVPFVVLVALVSGIVGLVRGAGNRRWAFLAIAVSLVGLGAAGLVFLMLLGGAGVMDNL